MDHEVKRSRPSWPTCETPSLLKIQRLAWYGGTWLQSQLLGRLRQENRLSPGGRGCSELSSCNCTPAWVTEQDSVPLPRQNWRYQKSHMVARLCESKEGSWHGEMFGQIPNLNLNKKIPTGIKSCKNSVCRNVFTCHSSLCRHIVPNSGHKS